MSSNTEEEEAILRKHAALASDWDALQKEIQVLREELKEDKWLTVFRTVTDQADGMMSSLEKAVNRCQVCGMTWGVLWWRGMKRALWRSVRSALWLMLCRNSFGKCTNTESTIRCRGQQSPLTRVFGVTRRRLSTWMSSLNYKNPLRRRRSACTILRDCRLPADVSYL